MPEPCHAPLLACSVLPTAGVPLMDGRAVLVGEDLPGGVLEAAEVTASVTRMNRATNVVTAPDWRLMPPHRRSLRLLTPSKGYFDFVRIGSNCWAPVSSSDRPRVDRSGASLGLCGLKPGLPAADETSSAYLTSRSHRRSPSSVRTYGRRPFAALPARSPGRQLDRTRSWSRSVRCCLRRLSKQRARHMRRLTSPAR